MISGAVDSLRTFTITNLEPSSGFPRFPQDKYEAVNHILLPGGLGVLSPIDDNTTFHARN